MSTGFTHEMSLSLRGRRTPTEPHRMQLHSLVHYFASAAARSTLRAVQNPAVYVCRSSDRGLLV